MHFPTHAICEACLVRPSQRVNLINAIGLELQNRYSFYDIDLYFAASNVEKPFGAWSDYEGKEIYAKYAVGGLSDEKLSTIAEDLEVDDAAIYARGGEPPKNWPDQSKFRLFISHMSEHKDKATRLRDCLASYYISGFVAHEDIRPTEAWEREIERALRTMDAFLAIHSQGFSKSVWAQQEIGFAYAAGVKIISFKMGEDPMGFIGKNQALPRLDRKAEDIAKEVHQILSEDSLTTTRMLAVMPGDNSTEPYDEIPF